MAERGDVNATLLKQCTARRVTLPANDNNDESRNERERERRNRMDNVRAVTTTTTTTTTQMNKRGRGRRERERWGKGHSGGGGGAEEAICARHGRRHCHWRRGEKDGAGRSADDRDDTLLPSVVCVCVRAYVCMYVLNATDARAGYVNRSSTCNKRMVARVNALASQTGGRCV